MAFKTFRKNCCGLDVHKTWIYACIGITAPNNRTEYKQARFSAFTNGLHDLAGWLSKYDCMEVCMESSGKYWIPVFNVLEQSCWVTLAHPKYGLALDGFCEKCYDFSSDDSSQQKLLLSSSPSARPYKHFSQVQSRVAINPTKK